MRILITGSSGQIGTNLALRLQARRPRGLRRRQAAEPVDGRVPDAPAGPRRPLPGVPRAASAASSTRRSTSSCTSPRTRRCTSSSAQPHRALENAIMTFNVLEYARGLGMPLVFSSSREVYGDVHRFEEYAEEAADFAYTESPYSASKIASEAFVYSYARCYGLATSSSASRTSTAASTTTCSRMERVLPLFMHQLSRGEAITVFGGDEKVLDFTYVDDCVDGIARGVDALAERRVANETINLAYGQGNTLVRAAELIAAELGVEPQITIAPSLLGEVTHYVADVTQGARAARLGAADAARRGHPAGRSPGSRSGAPRIRRRTARSSGRARRRARAWLQAAGRRRRLSASSRSSARRRPARPPSPACSRERLGAEVDLGRLGRALRRPPDHHGGSGVPGAARRRRSARRRGLGRRVPAARARRDRRDVAAGAAVVVGGTGLYFRAALSALELPPPPAPGAARTGRPSTTGSAPRRRTRCCRARPRRCRARPRERPHAASSARSSSPRRALARTRPTTGSGREDTRHPTTDRRARSAARRARPRGSTSARARWPPQGAGDEARGAWARPLSATARKVLGLEQFATLPERPGGRAGRPATRQPRALPAQVAATDARRRYPRRRTGLRRRSPMRSSRWHAQGNVYLVTDGRPLTPNASARASATPTASSRSSAPATTGSRSRSGTRTARGPRCPATARASRPAGWPSAPAPTTSPSASGRAT